MENLNNSKPLKTTSTNSIKIITKSTKTTTKSIRSCSTNKILEKKKFASNHLAYINGPILFTAPHSSKLYRGGKDYNRKETIHLREQFTSTLAIRWASQTEGSFCVWSRENKLNRNDVDPNYMQDGKKADSPFHQSLHWHSRWQQFHILFHHLMNTNDVIIHDFQAQKVNQRLIL